MKVQIEIFNFKHPHYITAEKLYNKKMYQYENAMMDYEDNQQEKYSDNVLKNIFKDSVDNLDGIPDKPEMPIPPTSYGEANLNNKIIMGYVVMPDKEGVKVYLDKQYMDLPCVIIKFDDKIINDLDNILK